MSTKGYGGRQLNKSARVITNDPKNEEIRLMVRGDVEKFATVKPKRVILSGPVGETIEQTVTIVPETKEPFRILKASAMKGTEITHELKETEVSGKPAYELKVVNTKDTPGRYYDRITLLTSRSDHTPLSVIVTGSIREKARGAQ
ncbi:MAG TPA: hypothetical protein VKN73_09545 [Desulfosalsimonadaceae bacterium]|nr:hypothetical protein [Desulfosalsimonadaceae bacterium]